MKIITINKHCKTAGCEYDRLMIFKVDDDSVGTEEKLKEFVANQERGFSTHDHDTKIDYTAQESAE